MRNEELRCRRRGDLIFLRNFLIYKSLQIIDYFSFLTSKGRLREI